MALIDLGELRDDDGGAPPTPRRRRGVRRRWQAALVLVCVLLALAGAAPTPRRAATLVPARSGSDAFVVGDLLVVVGPPAGGLLGDRELTAYRLPADGRAAPPTLSARWRTTVPGIPRVRPATLVAGVVLLLATSTDDPGEPVTTVALDAADGRERWRRPGSGAPTEGGQVLLVDREGPGGRAARVVDPATGAERWSLPSEAVRIEVRFARRGVDRLVRFLPSGRTEVRHVDSGRVLAEAVQGAPVSGLAHQVLGDLLLVLRVESPTLTVYGLDRLDQRWTVDLPSVAHVTSCGLVLCVWTDLGVRALDRRTGRQVWQDPRWVGAVPVGDRLVVTTASHTLRHHVVLVGAATGEVLADLGNWHGFFTPVDGGRPLIYREVRDRGMLVATVEEDRLRVLDVLPGDHSACQIGAELVWCQRFSGDFRLWWLTR